MKRSKTLFIVLRKGSDLRLMDVEDINEKGNKVRDHKKNRKPKVLSTNNNSTQNITASKRNKVLVSALQKSRQNAISSLKQSCASKNLAEDKKNVGKKMEDICHDIHYLPVPQRRVLAQMNCVCEYFVDEETEIKRQSHYGKIKGEAYEKFPKNSYLQTRKVKQKENCQMKTKLHEKEFVNDPQLKSLGLTKNIHLKNFQRHINDDQFHITKTPLLINNIKKGERGGQILSSPWCQTNQDFSRAKPFQGKLIQSDFRRNFRGNTAKDKSNLGFSDLSDIKLKKPKTLVYYSNQSSLKFDPHLVKSTRSLNVREKACRSLVSEGQIEIFLPPI